MHLQLEAGLEAVGEDGTGRTHPEEGQQLVCEAELIPP